MRGYTGRESEQDLSLHIGDMGGYNGRESEHVLSFLIGIEE